MRTKAPFHTIPELIRSLKKGEIVILLDDGEKENEGDFVLTTPGIIPRDIRFLITHGQEPLCVPMTGERFQAFGFLPDDGAGGSRVHAFSLKLKGRVFRKDPIRERWRTLKALLALTGRADRFKKGGAIVPLAAKAGGVLVRAGHTEACVDLARLAGHGSAGVICKVKTPEGRPARTPELIRFAKSYRLKIGTIQDLIEHRRRYETLVRKVITTDLPTPYGDFRLHVYESKVSAEHHLALTLGDISRGGPILVRVHSECLTGDVFHSKRCDCGEQLEQSMRMVQSQGRGVILYMRQEGRGIGLANKLRAYALQDQGLDTVSANEALGFKPDLRHYGIGAQVLVDLGLRDICLLTNNPKKIVGLEGYGLRVVDRIPIEVVPTPLNRRYLQTKKEKLGHVFTVEM